MIRVVRISSTRFKNKRILIHEIFRSLVHSFSDVVGIYCFCEVWEVGDKYWDDVAFSRWLQHWLQIQI